ncbi:MAG: nitroreductase family protein [Treponema sp.]|nr:nitroreductase family protein [Treponema sp.]
MDFLDLCKKRYSVRKFSSKAVEEEKIQKILEAGRIAPTAKNTQPQKIFYLKSEEALAKVNAATPMAFHAPVVLMICYDTTQSYILAADTHFKNYDSGEVDTAIVTTMMMMQATELGLGTLWARGFDSQKLIDAFNLPENMHPVCLLDIGYPADDCVPSERHTLRKSLSENLIEL